MLRNKSDFVHQNRDLAHGLAIVGVSHSILLTRQGLPTATQRAWMSRVTTLPAPTVSALWPPYPSHQTFLVLGHIQIN